VVDDAGSMLQCLAHYRGRVLLIRPDHYVAASFDVSDPDGAGRRFERLMAATWPNDLASMNPNLGGRIRASRAWVGKSCLNNKMTTISCERNSAGKSVLNLTEVIEHQRLGRFQLTTIALCILVAVLDGFDTQCIGLLAPAIAQSLNLDLHAFGPVFGAGLFGLMLGSLVMGPLPTVGVGGGR